MRKIIATASALGLLTTGAMAEDALSVQVKHAGAQASTVGSAEYFTGAVRIDSPFKGTGSARVGGATVTFEPGARTAWHTHPLGQTLIVTAGAGQVQHWNGPVQTIRPGDMVWIPPGVKHWHGASGRTGMSHIAIAESLDGKAVEWLEKVSDDQYRQQP
ncbi:MAG: cupin domain-containing protein [Rhodocyclales bacterium]|jgi:quercetin dioxygenase-like cupin family protein|nr:cupin domain-containing protein [Rhodocyclales bacterium]